MVEIENVYKVYQNSPALNGLTLSFKDQHQYVVRGASGSGKSTLLYMIGGLDRPTEGRVVVDGHDLSALSDEELAVYRNRFVGFVFQFHFLLPSIKCLDNILLPTQIAGESIKDCRKRIEKLSEELGVSHCLNKFPYQISGGEQQRVNIIRALSMQPRLLLCDEPTGNLDSDNSKKVMVVLQKLAKEFHSTLIVVTHDPLVADLFELSYFMRDGKLSDSQTELPPLPVND